MLVYMLYIYADWSFSEKCFPDVKKNSTILITPSSKLLEKKAPILHRLQFHTGRDRYIKYAVLHSI